jgi:hypothetical protein
MKEKEIEEEEETEFRISSFLNVDSEPEALDEEEGIDAVQSEENQEFDKYLESHSRLLSFPFPLNAHYFLDQISDFKTNEAFAIDDTKVNKHVTNRVKSYGIRGHLFYSSKIEILRSKREKNHLNTMMKLKSFQNAAKKVATERTSSIKSSHLKRKRDRK